MGCWERRIYYFGMQGTEHEYDSQRTRNNSQQYYIFTVYGSQNQERQTSPDQPPRYEPPQPPPLYEDVIKSPELYQKPPPAYNVV
ncbi:uncharacterized protein LOC120414693 isoform X2 [Culex pipiens pallens]|uniref:uncharacterized protein LOC120414693 isoform X2 n=1 Tax=Culex pipiens pallens TaxID=42434 RepID=UPI0022AA9C79|nr:uncharacterized protein LOC120414693 isoform X2 [Culex pipiens pallens]